MLQKVLMLESTTNCWLCSYINALSYMLINNSTNSDIHSSSHLQHFPGYHLFVNLCCSKASTILMENTSVWHNKHACHIITGPSLVSKLMVDLRSWLPSATQQHACIDMAALDTFKRYGSSSLNEEAGHCWMKKQALAEEQEARRR